MTLVELLMVLLIVAVMLALLLPAIHDAREASNRTKCVNNLRQMSLALQNYETSLGSYPPGVVDLEGPIVNQPEGYHIGWIVQLLPYMEQMGISMTIDSRESVYSQTNLRAMSSKLSSLACPSDRSNQASSTYGTSNYAGCHHDVEAPIDSDNHGVFFLNSAVRLDDIQDGLSYTVFVGEKLVGPDDLSWMSGTRSSLRNTGSPLQGARKGASPIAERPSNDLFVGGFQSWHKGGVNFAFGDGSVRFIPETVEPEILRRLGHRDDGETIGSDQY